MIYVAMLYGPIGAWRVEIFPAPIRYTSMPLRYYSCNGWFGGFLPTVTFALVAMTGDVYYGPRQQISVTLMTVVIGVFFLIGNGVVR